MRLFNADKLVVIGFLLAIAIAYAFYCGYQTRKIFQSLQKQGIPLMKHSMILGHLEVIGKLLADLPSDAHGDYMMVRIVENWKELFPGCSKCPPVAYIDLWPFAPPTMISLSPDISAQFTQDYSLIKAHQQKHFLYPLTHNLDVSSMEGAEWKLWRKRLNPGFSIQNITSRIPDVLEEVQDFVDRIESKAGKNGTWGEVFPLEDATISLALDVILRFVLNKRFHEQTKGRSAVSRAIIDTVTSIFFFVNFANAIFHYNPWRRFRLWNNYRIIKNALAPHLQSRISELERNHQVTNKTLVDLIAKSFEDEKDQADTTAPAFKFDDNFIEMAVGQINTFLFAGHDTTGVAICWLFHLLAQHPEVMAKVRAEHDAVLGPDPRQAAAVLRENPSLLNALTYTNAAVKESMRIHTNVGTMRRGEPGFFLVGPLGSGPEVEGKMLPTDGFVVWDGNFAIHRDPDLWHRVDDFLPERFLITDQDDPLYPPKNAWRPFEAGPRNCIGAAPGHG